MRLRTRLAVLVCKASGAVLRRLGRGGTINLVDIAQMSSGFNRDNPL